MTCPETWASTPTWECFRTFLTTTPSMSSSASTLSGYMFWPFLQYNVNTVIDVSDDESIHFVLNLSDFFGRQLICIQLTLTGRPIHTSQSDWESQRSRTKRTTSQNSWTLCSASEWKFFVSDQSIGTIWSNSFNVHENQTNDVFLILSDPLTWRPRSRWIPHSPCQFMTGTWWEPMIWSEKPNLTSRTVSTANTEPHVALRVTTPCKNQQPNILFYCHVGQL